MYKTRTVLWYMVFIGLMLDSMVKINTSITIVDMIQSKQSVILLSSGNDNVANNFTETNSKNIVPKQRKSIERIILHWLQIEYDPNGFSWNEYQQGLVLGSFYWLNWITHLPGGILAHRYGSKLVFGIILFMSAITNILIPIAAFLDYRFVIFLRALQGGFCGGTWASMHTLMGQWVPPNERSRFVTAYIGNSLGMALFFPIFGVIISISSWELVYSICALLQIMYLLLWKFLIFDSPRQHPRIDAKEREFILNSLGSSIQSRDELGPTPWKHMLTSRPVWIIAACQWSIMWGITLLSSQGPTYFKTIHNWNIRMSGILSGLPYILKMIVAYAYSLYADYLLIHDKMTRTNVRKMGGFFCGIVQGVCMIGLALSGRNAVLAIVFYSLAIISQSTSTSGSLANMIDISPNYGGIILGIIGTFTLMPGYINPYIVGALTVDNQTEQQWQYVFLIAASVCISCGIIYVLFANANLQRWNNLWYLSNEKELENLRNDIVSKANVGRVDGRE